MKNMGGGHSKGETTIAIVKMSEIVFINFTTEEDRKFGSVKYRASSTSMGYEF